MTTITQLDSQELRALIHAGGRRVLLKYEELESREMDPIRAILEKTQYGLSRKTLLELGHQVTQLGDSKLQGIWDRIFSAPRAAKEELMELLFETADTGFTHPLEIPGTDMTVFAEHFHSPLPVNGIKEQDYVAFSHLMRSIEEGKTNFVFDCTAEQKAELVHYLWQIGSRDLGRELIRFVTSFPHPIALRIRPESAACIDETNPAGYVLNFCLQQVTYVEKLMDGTLRSEESPLWLDLAHELIHIRHFLDGTITFETSKLFSSRFHFAEEQRAITGIYNDLPFDWQHENAHRLLQDRNLRFDHMEGVPVDAAPLDKMKYAIQLDSMRDVQEILEAHAPVFDGRQLSHWTAYALSSNRPEIADFLQTELQKLVRS